MRRSSTFGKLNAIVLLLLALMTLYPFVYILAYSFNDGADAMRGGIYFWPRVLSLSNYEAIFRDAKMLAAYKITILRTVIGTAGLLILCSAMAYAISKKSLPFRTFIVFFIFIPTLFRPGLIPMFILYRELHLINSFWVYIIPLLYNFMFILILRTFFEGLPEALEESAKVDGYGDFGIFLRIVLPLSGPVLATIALFQGVAQWNDWFSGTFFVTNKSLIPVQTLLQDLLTQSEALAQAAQSSNTVGRGAMTYGGRGQTTAESLRMSTLVIATLPIICVYPFLQRYFVKGFMVGSVKG